MVKMAKRLVKKLACKKMIAVAVLCMVFVCVAGTGCKNIVEKPSESVAETVNFSRPDFELPAWPPENVSRSVYPKLVRWEVTFFDGEEVRTFKVPAGERKLSLPQVHGVVTGVVAQPITEHGTENESVDLSFFLPAGCVYPYGKKLTWEDGWAASVANSVARQLVYGEELEIEDESNGENEDGGDTADGESSGGGEEGTGGSADGDGDNPDEGEDGKKTEIFGTGDAKSVLAQFNWQKYLTTLREKKAEDKNGKKMKYDPWINDIEKFAIYIKNLSTKASSSLGTTEKYALNVDTVIENIEFYRKNVNDTKLLEKKSTLGKFYLNESNKKELYMDLKDRTKKITASKMPLVRYIPYQDIMYEDQNLWLPYQKNVYFYVSENEIIQLYYLSATKTNLVILTSIDYNKVK